MKSQSLLGMVDFEDYRKLPWKRMSFYKFRKKYVSIHLFDGAQTFKFYLLYLN
jgi:hypothetical protein